MRPTPYEEDTGSWGTNLMDDEIYQIIKIILDKIKEIEKERECYDGLHSDKIYYYAMSEQIDILEYVIEEIIYTYQLNSFYPLAEEEEIALTKHLRGDL